MSRDATLGSSRARVVVVGGGVTGLTAAHRLVHDPVEPGLDVTLLEAGSRLGGKVRTIEVGGLRVEAGADSLVVRKPWAVDLCKELGLGEDLVVPATRGTAVWTRGRLVPFPRQQAFGIPASGGELLRWLRWPGMSLRGRLRATLELVRPVRREDGDESIGDLIARRMGPEAVRVLAGPLLAGLHAGDPYRLSVRATFPELERWERAQESLIRGARAALKSSRRPPTSPTGGQGAGNGASSSMFATVWGGLERMIDALAAAVGPSRVRLDTPAGSIERAGSAWRVITAGQPIEADAVVLATPAFEAARLLRPVNPAASRTLEGVPYTSTAVVALVYPPGTGARLPDATGFVVPIGERTITACTWLSRKWPQPDDPEDRAVARCFVGRAGDEQALEVTDEELVERVVAEVEAAFPIGARPTEWRVIRWLRAMPQYEVGHLERMEELDRAMAATPGVFLAGAGYRGIGVPDCVRQASEAAAAVREYLRVGPSPSTGGERLGAVEQEVT